MEDRAFAHAAAPTAGDRVERWLTQVVQGSLVLVFGTLPLVFVPFSAVAIDHTKVLFVALGLLLVGVVYCLALLRSGTVRLALALPAYAIIDVAIIALLSALLSHDRTDALLGDGLEVHTAGFMLLLAAAVVVPLLVGITKSSIVRISMLLGVSTVLLTLFHLVRLIAGPELLSFGVFNTLVASPLGSWNSLALFLGLSILLSLIALEQLPLTRWGKSFFAVVVVLSLGLLAVVNFFAVWIVLGLTALVVLMFSLVKNHFTTSRWSRERDASMSAFSLVLSGLVCVVSMIALFGGTTFSSVMHNWSGVQFVEVRPSVGATLDITRAVFAEDMLLGVGPNRFADAWRLHKDSAINTSYFWNADFQSGYSFLLSIPVTMGVLGALAWIGFLITFMIVGLRFVFRSAAHDALWSFIGVSSFVAGLYLWGMAVVYTPNATILLLAAFFTASLCASHQALFGGRSCVLIMAENRRVAIVVVAVTMVVIVGSVAVAYVTLRHYAAAHLFTDAVRDVVSGASVAEAEEQIDRAFVLSPNDVFARQLAEYQLAKITTLLRTQAPGANEQAAFEAAIAQGVVAANRAIERDPTDGRNQAMAGALYSVLAGIGVESTADRARAAFTAARSFDPQNPLYVLLEAQLAARIGDREAAHRAAREAVALKPNYTDALLFIADLDIASGNVSAAIDTTRSILSLEPENPARYFQLGVLYTAVGSSTEAIGAFEIAVALDPQYANARYFLARLYADRGDTALAREQLVIVRDLNPDNQEVTTLIADLDAGTSVGFATTSPTVGLPSTAAESREPVTTVNGSDTPLVTPVNVGAEGTPDTSSDQVNTTETSL